MADNPAAVGALGSRCRARRGPGPRLGEESVEAQNELPVALEQRLHLHNHTTGIDAAREGDARVGGVTAACWGAVPMAKTFLERDRGKATSEL